jgi:hypothetical protein
MVDNRQAFALKANVRNFITQNLLADSPKHCRTSRTPNSTVVEHGVNLNDHHNRCPYFHLREKVPADAEEGIAQIALRTRNASRIKKLTEFLSVPLLLRNEQTNHLHIVGITNPGRMFLGCPQESRSIGSLAKLPGT